MSLTRRTILQLAAASLATTTLPARATGTIEVVDALGRKVTLKSPVERVAIQFNYEEFTAVAGKSGWDKVVGISRAPWAGWRPSIFKRYATVIPNLAAMPDIGNTSDNTFSAEKVIALQPDVLILAEWAYSALKAQHEQIEAAGIPIVVIDYNAQLLERHLSSTRVLAMVMGTEDRGDELATLYQKEYADVVARVARAVGSGARARVYVEIGQTGPATIGTTYTNTMWGKLITNMGVENIAVGKLPGASGQLNPETILIENPELIVIAGSSWANTPTAVHTGYDATPEETRRGLAGYAARAGWRDLKAVKAGNLVAMEHGLCRTLFDYVAMQYIAKRLYPEAFADVDPVQSFRAYHERFLPVPFGGTWMLALDA